MTSARLDRRLLCRFYFHDWPTRWTRVRVDKLSTATINVRKCKACHKRQEKP